MSDTYRITAVTVDDFKCIRTVRITPPADANLILIGGKNRQGKSSLFHAFNAALGGAKELPDEPVRRGAERSEIRLEFNGGALTIRRTITAEGGGTLEVRDADGKVRAPQELLDKIRSTRFLNPQDFLRKSDTERAARVLKIIDHENRLPGLDQRYQRAFDARTEAGRDLKRLQAVLDSSPDVPEPAKPVDVAELVRERDAIDGELTAAKEAVARVGNLQRAVAAARDEVERCKKALADAEANVARNVGWLADAEAKVNAAGAVNNRQRREELTAQINAAGDHNREVAAMEAARTRRQDAVAAVAAAKAKHDEVEAAIKLINDRRAEILNSAVLPVAGLTVDGQALKLNGLPFDQASSAERWRVALALAIAAAPALADVWIEDGALLDDDALRVLEELAEGNKVRIWIERVGVRDAGAIVLHEGQVVGG